MRLVSFAAALVISLFAPAARAAGFQIITATPNGGAFATGVSADGQVVVGQFETIDAKVSAFRYTVVGGLVDIGDLPGGSEYATANAANADGSVIVGVASTISAVNPNGEAQVAFRWTLQGGLVALADLAGGTEAAFASSVSADGSRIVGASYAAADDYEAASWDGAAPPTSLGTFLSSMPQSTAYGVSANGKVIVGRSPSMAGNAAEAGAFRWTTSLGLVGIGDLPGGSVYASAYAVSGDGLVVVGSSSSASSGPNELEAFRHTESAGMQGLGALSPALLFGSDGLATNGDGSVIVGRSYVDADGNEEAFYWTASSGIQRLADVAAAAGVDIGGAILRQATGVSADGLVVVGIAQGTKSTNAFRLDLTGSTGTGSSTSTGTGSSTSSGTGGSESTSSGGSESTSTGNSTSTSSGGSESTGPGGSASTGTMGTGGSTSASTSSASNTSSAGPGGAGPSGASSSGPGDSDPETSDGCGCRLGATKAPSDPGLWLAAATALVVARRRRRL